MAFFVGILPNVEQDLPYYNRFSKQLMGLVEVGETNVVKDACLALRSKRNLMYGFQDRGYRTVGAGAMNWFRQETLTLGFQEFLFTGTDADAQIDFVIEKTDSAEPFFAFINFGETHAPFHFAGKEDHCPVDVRARVMNWPPLEEGPVGRENPAFDHQVRAAEFLDGRLPRLFSALPASTLVVLCGDHGECLGEDGYWGHGVSHPMVYEVPLSIFRLDGRPVEATSLTG